MSTKGWPVQACCARQWGDRRRQRPPSQPRLPRSLPILPDPPQSCAHSWSIWPNGERGVRVLFRNCAYALQRAGVRLQHHGDGQSLALRRRQRHLPTSSWTKWRRALAPAIVRSECCCAGFH